MDSDSLPDRRRRRAAFSRPHLRLRLNAASEEAQDGVFAPRLFRVSADGALHQHEHACQGNAAGGAGCAVAQGAGAGSFRRCSGPPLALLGEDQLAVCARCRLCQHGCSARSQQLPRTGWRHSVAATLKSMLVQPTRTSYRSPWQNGVAERFVGTVREELLNYVIVLNESHLRRLLDSFVSYYATTARTSPSTRTLHAAVRSSHGRAEHPPLSAPAGRRPASPVHLARSGVNRLAAPDSCVISIRSRCGVLSEWRRRPIQRPRVRAGQRLPLAPLCLHGFAHPHTHGT